MGPHHSERGGNEITPVPLPGIEHWSYEWVSYLKTNLMSTVSASSHTGFWGFTNKESAHV